MKKSGDFGLKAAKGEHLGAKRSFGKKKWIRQFSSAAWPQIETAVFLQRHQVNSAARIQPPINPRMSLFHSAVSFCGLAAD